MGGRILVVEDDDDLRETLAELFRLWGFEATAARDGREALELLRAREQRPDVIVLDLCMPRMNGEAFREQQLRNQELRDVPVIVMSGEQDLHERAASMHVDSAFKKPVNLTALLVAVERYCGTRP